MTGDMGECWAVEREWRNGRAGGGVECVEEAVRKSRLSINGGDVRD